MAKVGMLEQEGPGDPEFFFQCPGCGVGHWFKITGGPPRWSWNGDLDRPTIHPSIHVEPKSKIRRCHSWVREGRIQFLSDCSHALAGQTVDLPEIED